MKKVDPIFAMAGVVVIVLVAALVVGNWGPISQFAASLGSGKTDTPGVEANATLESFLTALKGHEYSEAFSLMAEEPGKDAMRSERELREYVETGNLIPVEWSKESAVCLTVDPEIGPDCRSGAVFQMKITLADDASAVGAFRVVNVKDVGWRVTSFLILVA